MNADEVLAKKLREGGVGLRFFATVDRFDFQAPECRSFPTRTVHVLRDAEAVMRFG